MTFAECFQLNLPKIVASIECDPLRSFYEKAVNDTCKMLLSEEHTNLFRKNFQH